MDEFLVALAAVLILFILLCWILRTNEDYTTYNVFSTQYKRGPLAGMTLDVEQYQARVVKSGDHLISVKTGQGGAYFIPTNAQVYIGGKLIGNIRTKMTKGNITLLALDRKVDKNYKGRYATISNLLYR